MGGDGVVDGVLDDDENGARTRYGMRSTRPSNWKSDFHIACHGSLLYRANRREFVYAAGMVAKTFRAVLEKGDNGPGVDRGSGAV